MIDTIVKIIDRIIGLRDRSDVRLRNLFADHIEPVFQNLCIIHKDYAAMVHDIESCVQYIQPGFREGRVAMFREAEFEWMLPMFLDA